MRYVLTVEFETWKALTAFIEATKAKGSDDVKLPAWTKMYETSPAIPVPAKPISVKDGTSAEFVFKVLVPELDRAGDRGLSTLALWKALRSEKWPYGRSWMNQILKEFSKRGLIRLEHIGVGGHGRYNTIYPAAVRKAV